MKKNAFWDEAFTQSETVAREVDVLDSLLCEHGQEELANLIHTQFMATAQALRLAMPQKVRERIGERLAKEQEAEFKAMLDKLMAELPEGVQQTDIEHFGEVFDAINTAV